MILTWNLDHCLYVYKLKYGGVKKFQESDDDRHIAFIAFVFIGIAVSIYYF